MSELKKYAYYRLLESDRPGAEFRSIRRMFGIKLKDLAAVAGVSSSTLSDFERGRYVPTLTTLRRYVDALLKLANPADAKHVNSIVPGVVEHRYFTKPVRAGDLVRALKAKVEHGEEYLDYPIEGYVLVDQVKLLKSLNVAFANFWKIYGYTTDVCVVFDNVILAAGPAALIREQRLKPRVIVINKPKLKTFGHLVASRGERVVIAISRLRRDRLRASLARL